MIALVAHLRVRGGGGRCGDRGAARVPGGRECSGLQGDLFASARSAAEVREFLERGRSFGPRLTGPAVINGKRVRLRRIERSDLPRFVEWMNDPELRDHLAAIYPLSQAQEEQWFESMLRLEPTLQPFAIDARLTPQGKQWTLVGTISFHNVDWRNRTAELGMFIGPRELWGKGFGTEALRALVAFAFRSSTCTGSGSGLRGEHPGPPVLRKGRLRGRGPAAAGPLPRGPVHETLVMGLLKHEWEGPCSGRLSFPRDLAGQALP